MAGSRKYDRIIDALQQLLESKEMESITVSEIAKVAGIGKGSIYYYFSSKVDIYEALIERNYKQLFKTSKHLAGQTDVPVFSRIAMLFQVCRDASDVFIHKSEEGINRAPQENAFLHHKFMKYFIGEMKPVLTEIIKQGIATKEIQFAYPDTLSEIVLIVLTIKFDNMLAPGSAEEIAETVKGLIALLEQGAGIQKGALDYLLTVLQ
ncbi:MAG: TetR/AcrR family transcriptional regulator [Lachnospira sp.]|nr:TetR/AcrR family transcriptional regulator [Lachnospira sp.]